MKYSIVIPTYNNCDEYLKPCIDSILKYSNLETIELVISANGCTDNTKIYLDYLQSVFDSLGLHHHLKIVWNDLALGYPKATNEGIKLCSTNHIVLLNNDTILLEQYKNYWLDLLQKPFQNDDCGISGVNIAYSDCTKANFAVFFCVMIHRKVFKQIGFLNEEYGIGSSEDIEFCKIAQDNNWKLYSALDNGYFPIYHRGEGTVHNTDLVKNWDTVFLKNQLRLAKKYNPEWYKWRLSNNYERAIFLKGDMVFPREATRYEWANKNLLGVNVFELGCSTGYGLQFLREPVIYTGLDYDPIITAVAQEQNWRKLAIFWHGDINKIQLSTYDTIIAFEVIEHLDNGLQIIDMLKLHCNRLLITVPHNEPKGFWGEHHKLHGLNESHFEGFAWEYINEAGEITDKPQEITTTNRCNLMIGVWNRE
jgi:glycosyltransferase involved in cell wall biosynthesis